MITNLERVSTGTVTFVHEGEPWDVVATHLSINCDRLTLNSRDRTENHDGTIEDARALLPRRVRVRGAGVEDALSHLPDVAQALPSSDGREGVIELRLHEGANPQEMLKIAFEQGVALEVFEVVDPNLHEVFVHLVGDEAREAALR